MNFSVSFSDYYPTTLELTRTRTGYTNLFDASNYGIRFIRRWLLTEGTRKLVRVKETFQVVEVRVKETLLYASL